jgi:hypothetical protein
MAPTVPGQVIDQIGSYWVRIVRKRNQPKVTIHLRHVMHKRIGSSSSMNAPNGLLCKNERKNELILTSVLLGRVAVTLFDPP